MSQLNLSNKNLQEIPDQANENSFTSAVFQNNLLSRINSKIGRYLSLQALHFDNNKISEIDPSIGNLKKLNTLTIGNNQLSKLPREIKQLTSLQILQLQQNKFKDFPYHILNIVNLRQLHLANNELEELPEDISNLQNLTHLYISNNKLKFLPASIAKLKNLQHLEIAGNPDLPMPSNIPPNQPQQIIQYILQHQVVPTRLDTNKIILFRNISDDEMKVRYVEDLNRALEETNIEFTDIATEEQIDKNSPPVFIIAPLDVASDPKLNFKILEKCISIGKKVYILIQDKSHNDGFINLAKGLEIQELHKHFNKRYPERVKVVKNISSITDFVLEALKQHNPEIKLLELSLTNIGHYDELLFSFDEEITCIVGENGTGKTTLLRSIALGLIGADHDKVNHSKIQKMLRINGIDDLSEVGTIKLKYRIDGEELENVINFVPNDEGRNVSVDLAGESKILAGRFRLKTLVVGFPQVRNEGELAVASTRKKLTSPHVDDLVPLINNVDDNRISLFHDWIANLFNDAQKAESSGEATVSLSEERKLINKVFEILSSFLNHKIEFLDLKTVSPPDIWIKTFDAPNGVPLRIMSHGFQVIIGWLGYFLNRLHQAYPLTKDFTNEHSIVVIDEIDTSVHPTWQARLIKTLRNTFPKTQFIITTHSPLCTYGLNREQIVVLGFNDGKIRIKEQPSDNWAWSYEEILRETFNTNFDSLRIEEYSLDEIEEKIKLINSKESRTSSDEDELQNLMDTKRRLKESHAVVDEFEKGLLSIREKERELDDLIKKYKK